MNKNNTIPYLVIAISAIYFASILASVIGLLLTGYSVVGAVLALEISTMLSAPAILLLFESIPNGTSHFKRSAKKYSIIFMACCMVLTIVVHFLQITVTKPLIDSGVFVPTYLQVGYWPSVSMAVDYLAWGFFMGSAFLAAFFAVNKEVKLLKTLKYTLLVCAILCYAGLLGCVLLNENCWYIAPLGYGVGTVIICIELLLLSRGNCEENRNSSIREVKYEKSY